MKVEGFDWDHGNREKIKKHKVDLDSVEDFLINYKPFIFADVPHSTAESRFVAFDKYKDRNM